MIPCNNKRKLPANNQNLKRDSLTLLCINLPKLNGSLKTFEKSKLCDIRLKRTKNIFKKYKVTEYKVKYLIFEVVHDGIYVSIKIKCY